MTTAAQTLTLRFKKKTDGAVSIGYFRADGSATWTTGDSASAHHFVAHDLGHYAVESTLGLSRAFLGHLADGWALKDFGAPWPRGRFHPDDLSDLTLAEFLAAHLDRERASGETCTAREFACSLAQQCGVADSEPLPWAITDEQLTAIRTQHQSLIACWDALAPGETLALDFYPNQESA